MATTWRNPWFYLAVLFLAADIATVAAWYHVSQQRRPTRILRSQPQLLEKTRAPVLITFNRDLVFDEELDTPVPLPWLRATPTVELEGTWRSPRILEVRAAGGFSKATAYELAVDDGLLDVDGFPLETKQRVRFRTPRLNLVDFRQTGLKRDWRLTVRLRFNDAVSDVELDKRVRFTDESGAEVPMQRRTRPDRRRKGRIETAMSGAVSEASYISDARRREKIHVTVEAGLVGVSGPRGLDEPARASIDVETGLTVKSIRTRTRDVDDSSIFLDFSLDVDPEVATPFVSVDPVVPITVVDCHNGLEIRGPFKAGQRYRLVLEADLPAEGGRFLADEVTRSVRIPDLGADLAFVGEGQYLSPAGSRTLLLRSVNVDDIRVDIYKVFRNNVVHFVHDADYVGYDVIERKRIRVHARRNEVAITRLDLDDWLGAGARGTYTVSVRSHSDYWSRIHKTVTLTELGLHAKILEKDLLVWVTRIEDGAPVEGARVGVRTRNNQEVHSGRTDADGVVRFDPADLPLSESEAEGAGGPFLVTAESGDDFSYVVMDEGRLSTVGMDVHGRPFPENYEAFVYPEREVIRPGETIHLRGLVRRRGGALPDVGMPLRWEVLRPDGRPASHVPASLSDYGTVELAWTAEKFYPTGRYRVRLRAPGQPDGAVLGDSSFRVEEFLPVTLRVQVDADDRRTSGGDTLEVRVRGEQLFGGGAAGLVARARCRLQATTFTHPDFPELRFSSSGRSTSVPDPKAEPIVLDERGEGTFRFEIPEEIRTKSALRALVTVSVFEVGGRAVSVHLSRDVDPLDSYIGLRCKNDRAVAGELWVADCLAITPAGTPADVERVTVRMDRLTWQHTLKKRNGVYQWASEERRELTEEQSLRLLDGKASISFTPKRHGNYEVSVSAARGDDQRTLRSSMRFYAGGPGGGDEEGTLEIPYRITLTPDRESYRAGDVAHLRVQSPITGVALLTLETDRVHELRRFEISELDSTLKVPILADMLPHGYVTLTVVGGRGGSSGLGVPLRAFGAAPLLRDPKELEARIAFDLPASVRPGDELPLEFEITREGGEPVDGEVAVALVDAGILALTPYLTPDPLEFFSARRALGSRCSDIFSSIVAEPGQLLAAAPSQAGGDADAGPGAYLNPVQSKRVKSISIWKTGLHTDEAGRVFTSLPAPDFDGELVVVAVVSGRRSVGSVRRAVKVRRPVIIQPSLPRFLASGDRFDVPVTVHNTTDSEIQAELEIRLPSAPETNEEEGAPIWAALTETLPPGEGLTRALLSHDGPAERPTEGNRIDGRPIEESGWIEAAKDSPTRRSLTLPAGERSTAWFSLRATEAVGTATIEVRCEALGETIVRSTELAVRPAAPALNVGKSLILRSGESRSFESEVSFLKGTTRAELTLSTSILPSLEGPLRYLFNYPYGCVEQTSSSLLPWITLRGYLESTGSEEFTADQILDNVRGGVERLLSMQTADGGLGTWSGSRRSYPWGSLYGAFVLLEAKAAGHDVPERALNRLLDYVEELLSRPGHRRAEPRTRGTIRAQALWVLARAGRVRRGWIETLYERRDELTRESRAILAVAAALSGVKLPGFDLEQLVGGTERDAAAQKNASSRDRARGEVLPARELSGTLYSRGRELCVILSAMVDLGKPPEVILPLIQRLVAAQQEGRYRSTQENAFAILAFSKAAKVLPRPSGPCRVRVELPGGAIEREVGDERLVLPLDHTLGPLGAARITLEGEGPVYVSWNLRGVPISAAGMEEDVGIRVRRSFLRPDGEPWQGERFREGDRVLVRFEIEAPRSLQNIAIVDPLPAGFEIENPKLATTDGKTSQKGRLRVQRSEMRDDRLILFANPGRGKSSYTYVVRAVTPGSYTLPPIAAECMYDTAIRSVHGSGKIEVVR